MKRILLTLLMCICASLAMNAVTFNVTVPAGTRACYIAGDFNGWDAGNAIAMQSSGTNIFTLTLDDVSETAAAKGYKYLCGQDWAYVEKGASGEEIGNRTSVTNMDVVASWAKLYNPDIEETKLVVNGYTRIVKVFLPSDYTTSTQSYPVVYMTGVQARYDNAGSDSDRGDDHMGDVSWNIPGMAAEIEGGIPCIFVSMYGFVPENIPYAHPDYAGSGKSDEFIAAIEEDLMPYINNKYRTLTDAVNTSIVGADIGGLLSVYAALQRPDLFGQCAALSPVIWLNKDSILTYATNAATGNNRQRFYLSVGGNEPEIIKNDAVALQTALASRANTDVRFTTFTGVAHNDVAWGKAFKSIYPYLLSADAPATGSKIALSNLRQGKTSNDFATTPYSIVSAVDSENLVYDADSKFTYITDYISSGNEVAAQVTITEIPASIKTQYYWNVSRSTDGTGELLKTDNGNIGFSSKKSSTSWHRVAIFEDESVKDIAANSTAFRLATASENITMSVTSNYTVKASASFAGSDKSFSIHYGSVNSGSDMGAITDTHQVSDNCTAADINYDFLTNRVTITETNWGETIEDVKIEKFMAVPSFCQVGASSQVTLAIADAEMYDVTVDISHNYGTKQNKALTRASDGTWSLYMSDLQAGIYHISLNVSRGETEVKEVESIAIKVLNTERDNVSVKNPYEAIDWETINQYKANFHTHTTQSFDAQLRVDETVDKYHAAGYKILALTEHDANPYPWEMFDMYNSAAESRTPALLDMIAIPGNELSKSYTNSWNEVGGSEYNHHNDFFTGRQGQEFATLRESYAYTEKLGGMQLINHPGQYWKLENKYTPGEKNSPEWHAENFLTYSSLIGLEVYNQGNRRPNDRILWDQILDITMEQGKAVWGYSCDDSHNNDQLFRNYNFMLMPQLTVEDLKDAMRNGTHYFSYEYSGSGKAKAPRIESITVDKESKTITIESDDASTIYWICSTDISDSNTPSTRKSTVLAIGKEFDHTGFKGTYVRALLVNEFGETCTQPFGFETSVNNVIENRTDATSHIAVYPNPASDIVKIDAGMPIQSVMLYNVVGQCVKTIAENDSNNLTINVSTLTEGHYIVSVSTATTTYNEKLIVK